MKCDEKTQTEMDRDSDCQGIDQEIEWWGEKEGRREKDK